MVSDLIWLVLFVALVAILWLGIMHLQKIAIESVVARAASLHRMGLHVYLARAWENPSVNTFGSSRNLGLDIRAIMGQFAILYVAGGKFVVEQRLYVRTQGTVATELYSPADAAIKRARRLMHLRMVPVLQTAKATYQIVGEDVTDVKTAKSLLRSWKSSLSVTASDALFAELSQSGLMTPGSSENVTTQRKAFHRLFIATYVILLVLLAVVLQIMMYVPSNYRQTSGTVFDLIGTNADRNPSTSNSYVVSYEVSGKQYTVNSNAWTAPSEHENDTVTVWYDPQNPQQAAIESQLGFGTIALGAFGAFMLTGLVLSAISLFPVYRSRSTMAAGKI